jgi:hypothetical protein
MLRLRSVAFVLSLSAALAGAACVSAMAQDHHDHYPSGAGHGPGGHGPGGHFGAGAGFHGHDFAHFSPAERARWAGGGWHHQWYNGRYGWWWAVGGIWYFYASPIYPYPDYVADTFYDPDMAAPPQPAAPTAGYQPGSWYFCSASGTYYPYVQTCAVPWTPVSPTPPQGPPQ